MGTSNILAIFSGSVATLVQTVVHPSLAVAGKVFLIRLLWVARLPAVIHLGGCGVAISHLNDVQTHTLLPRSIRPRGYLCWLLAWMITRQYGWLVCHSGRLVWPIGCGLAFVGAYGLLL